MAEEVKPVEPAVTPTPQPTAAPAVAPTVDTSKLEEILDKKLSVTEKGVMKSYFEQQGLSPEEATQAIEQFKTGRQKAQGEQSEALTKAQQELQRTQAELAQTRLESAAQRQAAALGLNEKNAKYAVRLADLSTAIGQDGAISEETVKAALEQVLKDVPALAPTTETSGFRDIGLPSAAPAVQAQVAPQNTKRWNRFNHT